MLRRERNALQSSSLLNTANVSSTYWKYANGLLTTLKSFSSWWPTKMFANAGPSGEPMAHAINLSIHVVVEAEFHRGSGQLH